MSWVKTARAEGARAARADAGLRSAPGEFAPGIPAARGIEPLPTVSKAKPEEWTLAVQRHFADVAGEHLDFRLIDPKDRAHSWAIPRATLPKPGDPAVLAVPQPTHTGTYARTEGLISEGYGKGRVKLERLEPIDVHHASNEGSTRLRFNAYTSRGPEEFAIVDTGRGNQLLVNKTVTRERAPHLPLGEKPALSSVESSKVDFSNADEVMMPKFDGAHALLDFGKPGSTPRVYSYRIPKRHSAGLIEHTHKVPFLMEREVPRELKGTTLRAELVALDGQGKALPATTLGGMLNAAVPKSREKQKELGATLMPMPFDVVRYRGKDVSTLPFAARLEILRTVSKATGLPAPETAATPREKRELLRTVGEGQHPLTNEGVVLRTLDASAPAAKVKFRPDYDVYVRGVAPSIAKGRAGGFTYSLTPRGPIAGNVGTGFDHATLRDMLESPKKYVGRAAKVQAEKQFESGALSKPSFIEWHLDKGNLGL